MHLSSPPASRLLPSLTWLGPSGWKGTLPRAYEVPATGWGVGFRKQHQLRYPRKSGEPRPEGEEELLGFLRDPGGEHVMCEPNVYRQNQISSEVDALMSMFLHLAPPSLNPPVRFINHMCRDQGLRLHESGVISSIPPLLYMLGTA